MDGHCNSVIMNTYWLFDFRCALVDSFLPGQCPETNSPLENAKNAIQIAEERLQIPPIIDPEDVIAAADELSMMVYLSYFKISPKRAESGAPDKSEEKMEQQSSNKEQEAASIRNKLADLEAEMNKAVEWQDLARAREIDAEIEKLKESLKKLEM